MGCFTAKKMRWCTVSEPEQRKCADLAKALLAHLSPATATSLGRLSCVRAYSTADCLTRIRVGYIFSLTNQTV